MSKIKPAEHVARAALALRATAPAQWEAFLKALDMLRMEHDDQLAEAPPDRLHWAQGRSRVTRDLLRDLMNAPALVQQYEQARKK